MLHYPLFINLAVIQPLHLLLFLKLSCHNLAVSGPLHTILSTVLPSCTNLADIRPLRKNIYINRLQYLPDIGPLNTIFSINKQQ